ncbi:hypothetical protein TSUD_250350 [Trifolium subterraneum]|nr:hypothetical protein TSUD_250350 [Trifolium subterraneum]
MDPGTFDFNTGEPQIQLYFLLGLVYAVVTPFLPPYIVVFFGLAYLVYRHQEAMVKDTLERTKEPNFNLKEFLHSAYIHLVFKSDDDTNSDVMSQEWKDEPVIVQTKRQSRRNTPAPSKQSGGGSIPSSMHDTADV